uniref:non-specific serine/threonine protein kinase n=1 Tax=Strongyloides venezuelensis TaxID=75913 RepID=A0A0K0FAK3_STRVS
MSIKSTAPTSNTSKTSVTISPDDPTNLPDLTGRLLKDYVVITKIDEGGFGSVYLARKYKKKKVQIDPNFDISSIPENELKEYCVVKAESNFTEGGCGLKMEVIILKKIAADFGNSEQFGKIFVANRRSKYSYIFMTLLGKSLKQLLKLVPNNKFTDGTWARVAIQSLYAIKQLHEIGFIHRDLKPANFVIGHMNDSMRCRFIHLIDFGLARQYIIKDDKGKVKYRQPRKRVDFRGTERYCSMTMHYDKEQMRVDDIWSLLFTLTELRTELPWSNVSNDELEEVKKNYLSTCIIKLLPSELEKPIKNLDIISYKTPENRPNYEEIYKGLVDCLKNSGYTFDDKYDWEEEINKNAPSMVKTSQYSSYYSYGSLEDDVIAWFDMIPQIIGCTIGLILNVIIIIKIKNDTMKSVSSKKNSTNEVALTINIIFHTIMPLISTFVLPWFDTVPQIIGCIAGIILNLIILNRIWKHQKTMRNKSTISKNDKALTLNTLFQTIMPFLLIISYNLYFNVLIEYGFQSNTFRLFLKYTEMIYLPCCPLSSIFFIEVYRNEFINFFCPNRELFKKSTNSMTSNRLTNKSTL